MARSSPNSLRSAGFTLVEALVALTLFALLSVFLFGGLRFGNRAVGLGTDAIERASGLALAEGFLRQQLAAAQPLPMEGSDGQVTVAFDGAPDRVQFVTMPPAYLARGGFHWLRLALEDRRLIVRWEPAQASGRESAPAVGGASGASVLLEGVGDIALSYFGAREDEKVPTWHDRWQDAAALPDLIRLHIAFADGRPAPDLLVATRLAEIAAAAR